MYSICFYNHCALDEGSVFCSIVPFFASLAPRLIFQHTERDKNQDQQRISLFRQQDSCLPYGWDRPDRCSSRKLNPDAWICVDSMLVFQALFWAGVERQAVQVEGSVPVLIMQSF